ncbi:hypothetical protein WN66_00066 [Saccharomyces cerevisiae]|nr:hypothetical protein WN66_00066 [Saccharomyces cerevisiae]
MVSSFFMASTLLAISSCFNSSISRAKGYNDSLESKSLEFDVVDVVDVVAAEGTAPAVVDLAPDIFRSFLTTQLFFDNQIPVVIVVEISSTLVLLLSAFFRNLVP